MISVIIPTLEEEAYLPLLLADLKRQSERPADVIVVDACSADRTIGIARRAGAKTVEHAGKNPAAQRNAGAAIARGDFLVFIDADIRIRDADLLKKAAAALSSHDGAVVPVKVVKEERGIADAVFCLFPNLLVRIAPSMCGRGAFMAVRKGAFKRIGGFDTRRIVTEDVDLFRRLARHGSVCCIDSCVEESSRRYRKRGHAAVLAAWAKNAVFAALTGRSFDKEWGAVR